MYFKYQTGHIHHFHFNLLGELPVIIGVKGFQASGLRRDS